MMSSIVPFSTTAAQELGLAAGNLVRYGAILKDASTGRIVGHLQETGLVQKALQSGLALDPTGATNLIGIAQNAAIAGKINAMQSMLGTMQVLQVATLASSVAGIGVTAATSAMILQRLRAVNETVTKVEQSVDALPSKWREMDLGNKLVMIGTSVERLQEVQDVTSGSNHYRTVSSVEEKLHYGFNDLHAGLCNVVVQARVDPDLLRSLLAGLALCGGAEIKALLWLDEKEKAERRAVIQCQKLQELSFIMPRDVMAGRLPGGVKEAKSISSDYSEIRYRVASQPHLARQLLDLKINGREYVEKIQNEDEHPLLFLPAHSARP